MKFRGAVTPPDLSPEEACSFTRDMLSRVGDKWSVLVIVLLGEGTQRFSDLRRAIDGISPRMLTMTLRAHERDGLVLRSVYPTIPPRVEYSLTPLGKTLLETVKALAQWTVDNRRDIEGARADFDRRETAEVAPLIRGA